MRKAKDVDAIEEVPKFEQHERSIYLVNIRISLSKPLRQELRMRLQRAFGQDGRLAKRILSILEIADGIGLEEVAERLGLSVRSVRDYLKAFILKGMASLRYKRPSGRPKKLTKSQRKELCELIDGGPEEAGYDYGCWTTVLIQELIRERYGVSYSVNYIAELLKTLGYSYQKARFVSEHIEDVSDEQECWLTETWPEITRLAQEKNAMVLFGDEASFAQWGTLSYTWSQKGHQPVVKTSGTRRAYKVFGLIDYVSGAFFYKTLEQGRFNSDRYAEFLAEVLEQTSQHLILIQDGARYHTSKAMNTFFDKHSERLTVFQLPRYSPELNPIEYLWRNVKKLSTHLRYHPTFQALVDKVDDKLAYFASLPESIFALMGTYSPFLGLTAS